METSNESIIEYIRYGETSKKSDVMQTQAEANYSIAIIATLRKIKARE